LKEIPEVVFPQIEWHKQKQSELQRMSIKLLHSLVDSVQTWVNSLSSSEVLGFQTVVKMTSSLTFIENLLLLFSPLPPRAAHSSRMTPQTHRLLFET
jgi:hypothetical protein